MEIISHRSSCVGVCVCEIGSERVEGGNRFFKLDRGRRKFCRGPIGAGLKAQQGQSSGQEPRVPDLSFECLCLALTLSHSRDKSGGRPDRSLTMAGSQVRAEIRSGTTKKQRPQIMLNLRDFEQLNYFEIDGQFNGDLPSQPSLRASPTGSDSKS